jgi:hypothetical protein
MPTPKNNSPPLPAHFHTEDMTEAFKHFLPIVEKLPADEIPAHRGDVNIARYNVERAVDAVSPRLGEVPAILPKVSVKRLLELPSLALALVYADGRVPRATAGDIDAAFAKVSPLRELTLAYLEVVGGLGLVPLARVQAIRTGKGKLDNARDCVDIAGLFEEFEGALAGKHPFTSAHLTELATTGTWLVKNISPKGAVKSPTERDPAAVVRDHFWKALEEGYDELRTVGVALWGIKSVDAYVPPLFSREHRAKGAPAAPSTPPGTGG